MVKFNMKKYWFYIVLCITLIIVSVLSAITYMSYVTNSINADSISGIEAASDTKTMYYLNIPIKGYTGNVNIYPNTNDYRFYAIKDRLDDFSASQEKVQFIFTFNNIRLNGSPLICTWKISCTFRTLETDIYYKDIDFGGVKPMPRITFNEDISINIREEYYTYFEQSVSSNGFKDFSITYIFNGNGYLVYNGTEMRDYPNLYEECLYFNCSDITTRKEDKASDYDPIGSEGQVPDNGGIGDRPIEVLKSHSSDWIWWFVLLCVSSILFIWFFPKFIDLIVGVLIE